MKQIVCFGEVLWDMLPKGRKIGGAPLNVALRFQSLGNKSIIISSIGNDQDGKDIIQHIQKRSADTNHLQISNKFETSRVLVTLNDTGSATYEIKKPCAWDDILLLDKDKKAVRDSDAFIFGSLSARMETSHQTLLSLLKESKFNVFDINLRAPHYQQNTLESLMQKSDFIKLNDEEILKICQTMGTENQSPEDNIRFISKKTNTQRICVTLGEKGAVLFEKGKFYYNHGYKVTVADTVGSGDSFLAALISKMLNGTESQKALDFACATGAIVASKHGANHKVTIGEINNLIEKENIK